MNGGFRVRPDGQFVSNSLNVKATQKGFQEAGEANEAPSKGAADRSGSSSPLPSISIPKGGGAIRGIGEKFAANPVTGTGSLNVPIFTSPGRSGFGPQLSLSYDSGSGNGPFGFGWSLSLPSITRKTDKGLPEYQDTNESDIFILSGAEDLVPVFKKDQNGNWIRDAKGNMVFDEEERNGYMVRRYRPRIEGLFARIERWTHAIDGDIHWRSISKDNILTVYGKDKQSRIADPTDGSRIFSWLICQSYDDKGNAIVYEYTAEDDKGVDSSQANEANRLRTANRYLKRIQYGNHQPLLLDTSKPSFRKLHTEQTDFSFVDWMFEVVFDYDEGHYEELPLDNTRDEDEQHRFVQASASAGGAWSVRPDPFSTYRAGFEVRTYRRCQRVLMFHHFPELGSEPCLVRSTEFDYSDLDYSQPVVVEAELNHKGSTRFSSFIQSVTQSGYVRDETRPVSVLNGVKYLSYLRKSLPPLEFEYSKATIHEEIKEIDSESLENLPYGLDGTNYQWVDLDGEGLSGILTEQAEAWFYKPNLGNGKFGPMERVASKPSLAALNSGTQLLDLAGDGQLDVAELGVTVPGFYERTHDQKWENFIPFTSLPNLSWKDPNLRFVDLTGDGHADVMVTENEVITWYPSLAEEGFGEGEKAYQPFDEEKGPRLVFADGTQSIYLSDMSGDGLSDLVRIRNGEVCYWPNLGYGRFGARVTMDNAPWFDSADLFDQKRIRLADIDGSGTTDIFYLGRNGIQIYFNRSGNSYSSVQMLSSLPHIDNHSSIQVTDLFGNGTAYLVWSSPLPGDSQRPMQYIDLMGGNKPHLLVRSKNNLGAETKVNYVASTKFYLDDKAKGKPWVTKIPFPVHVVERVETFDRISRNRFVTRYAYHHGYFDGIEREFRGFGMVEQRDTEEFAALSESDLFPFSSNIDEASHVPPVLTKTWFHTGAYFEGETISRHFEEEYYSEGDPSMGEKGPSKEQLEAMLLDDSVLPETLTAEEEREACRSLKGAILRQEIYALDGTEEEDRPYNVSERNYTIKQLQPRSINKHSVFFTHARETIDFHYERKLYDINEAGQTHKRADPRVTHAITLAVDDFGNVLQSAAISYGRRYDDPDKSLTEEDRKKQKPTLNNRALALATYNESGYTNPIDDIVNKPDAYRAPLPCEMRTYELLKMTPDANERFVTNLFRFNEIRDKINGTIDGSIKGVRDGNHDINYEDIEATTATTDDPHRRLIEHMRTLYRSDDLTGLLPPGVLNTLALPGESYKLAFTPGLISSVYQREFDNQPPEDLLSPADRLTVLGGKGGDSGGYVDLDRDGNWWIPSGRMFYDINANENNPDATAAAELEEASGHFFLPRKFTDPFGHSSTVDYDQPHDLLIVRAKDAVNNVIHAENDYRVLQPELVSDPNENRSKVIFDALGMVAGTAVMGKEIEPDDKLKGDSLDEFEPDLIQAQIDAFMAKPREPGGAATQIVHDLLKKATSRIIYDIDRFKRLGEPPFAAAIARETHSTDLDLQQEEKSKLQVSFSYSDGFGREIQKKIQAEPGPLVEGGAIVNPRWVGSGWTIFNNKGKPVRKYEPFFSPTHQFEFAKIAGVSSILFYDPVERVVATLHPNNTYEKVVFDPWYQETWDVNDTMNPMQVFDPSSPNVLPDHTFNPADDPDVGGYFRRLPQGEYLPTWYDVRMNPGKSILKWPDLDPISGSPIPENKVIRAAEKSAATKAAKHAATPGRAYLDTLGRTFLTIADNGLDQDGKRKEFKTHIELDIENNQRKIIDAKDRIVMRYDYDMLSNRIHQESMEAGERWMLNDVTGKPIRAWDSRRHNFRTEYDKLRRPLRQFVRGTDADRSDPRTLSSDPSSDVLFEKTEYGEGQENDIALNLRTRVFKSYDGAGIVTNIEYDFKGNLLRSMRELAKDYKNIINWNVMQTDETFLGSITYDALNRPIQIVAPHSSRPGTKFNVSQPVYNEANLLERMDVWLEQDTEPNGLLDPNTATRHSVTNIDYNARGQRILIQYGNGAETRYRYDPDTFRLIHLYTRRSAAFTEDCGDSPPPPFPAPVEPPQGQSCGLQNMYYTYDPVGNITTIRDDAQHTIYFSNSIMWPESDYTYDAIYRLINAKGREHIGSAQTPWPTWDDRGRTALLQPGNPQQMRNYTEEYFYDEVGNIDRIKHSASNGNGANQNNWIRRFTIDPDPSDPAKKKSNRLTACTVGNQTGNFTYDAHGNMTRMAHFNHADPDEPNMHWDFKDQLQIVDKGNGCKAYYVYDAAGQRVRKAIEQNDTRLKERIYIGGFEIYRKYSGNTIILERETLHIMDDKQRIALVEARTQGDDGSPEQLIRYQFGNHLGSASLELDDQARIISYEEYYPYGSTSYQAVDASIKAAAKRYRYTGKEQDEESGLYYHGARYYAPWLGRWTKCDPIGLADGINLYIYTGSSPIGFIDPTGTDGRTTNIAQMERRRKEIISEIAETEAILAVYDAIEAVEKANLDALRVMQKDIHAKIAELKEEIVIQNQIAKEARERAEKHAADARKHARQASVAKIAGGYFLAAAGCASSFGIGCLVAAGVGAGESGAGVSQLISGEETRNPFEEGASLGLQKFGVSEEWANTITGGTFAGYELVVGVQSIRSFDPTRPASIREIKGSNPVSLASSAGGDAQPMSVVRIITKGEKVPDLINEGKALTWQTGNEHAVVKLATGERALVSGGPGGIKFAPGQVKIIFGHSHPTSAPPSAADVTALQDLNQSKQYVFHGGQVTIVRKEH